MSLSIKIVSGLSGSGKSTALRAMEDEGYFCIDNMPPALIVPFAEMCKRRADTPRVAIGLDVRGYRFWEDVDMALEKVRQLAEEVEIIFLEAADEVLIRRYSESRRPHPLSKDGDILAGIEVEKRITMKLRGNARWIIDTTHLNVHQLRQRIIEHLRQGEGRQGHPMVLRLQSFGYKHGLPLDSDLVFDARVIPNPYFEPLLRPLSGQEDEVRSFVMDKHEARELIDRLAGLLGYFIPRYEKEGKAYLTVSVGCTGGRHRSVVVVEELARRFKRERVEIFHRDIERG